MLGWLRRRICRCPEMSLIENAGYVTGFSQTGSFGVEHPIHQPNSSGLDHPVGRLDQYEAEGSIAPPVMQVHIGGATEPGPPLYDELVAAEAKQRRHLHVVPDETE